jgi:multisubunit Na+/H+ antiporter MnhF subunit
VNVWLWGASVLLLGLVPCGALALRASRIDAVVALQTAGTVTTLTLVLLAEGFHRGSYMGLALALAFSSFVGTLVFTRFLGRHL